MQATVVNDQGAITIAGYRFGFVRASVQRNPPAGCTTLCTFAELGPLGGFVVPGSVGTAWTVVILAPLALAFIASVLRRRVRRVA